MDPIEIALRNLILLRRLENGVNREVQVLIGDLMDEVVAMLARLDPASAVRPATRRRRLEKLLTEIERASGASYEQVRKLIRQRLAEIGAAQAGVAGQILKAATPPSLVAGLRPGEIGINRMKAILDTDPIHGELLGDWMSRQATRTQVLIRAQLRLGMAQAETTGQLVRRVRSVFPTTRHGAEAIVRTAVTHVSNTAHQRVYASNPRVTETFEYVATLDSRTTDICIALDGRTFRYDDPKARVPPQHVNCRSTTRAIVKGADQERRSFAEWFDEQSAAKQDAILGPARARLYRSGKISLRDLIRSDGTVATVAELEAAA